MQNQILPFRLKTLCVLNMLIRLYIFLFYTIWGTRAHYGDIITTFPTIPYYFAI